MPEWFAEWLRGLEKQRKEELYTYLDSFGSSEFVVDDIIEVITEGMTLVQTVDRSTAKTEIKRVDPALCDHRYSNRNIGGNVPVWVCDYCHTSHHTNK